MTQNQSFWHRLLERQVSRRQAIGTAAAVGAASALPLTITPAEATANNGAPANPTAANMKAFPPFRAVEANFADTITLPAGYRYQILAPWGEKMNDAGDTIGFNHDYVGYFPIDMLDGGNSSTDALLTINHEYVNPLFVGGNTKERTPEQIRTEMRSVGVSVVRVRREGSEWKVVMDPRNRRIDGMTEIALTGPARGSAILGGATTVRGSVGNCSGGQTPWGTLLTCEENVDGYTRAWPGTGYNALHQGWVTEIDPFDQNSVPRKHTALGRFRHENAAVKVATDGRVVVYMGDDMRDACVYKFVSKGKYDAKNRQANMNLLAEGDLYVADFSRGQWLLLDYDRNEKVRNAKKADGTPLVRNQAEVLADARASAIAIGATPTDRPEDIEIHPLNGDVYVALTNNSTHGNFYGQIVRFTEKGGDHTATAFKWDVFAVGGRTSGFSSPDNLVFDPYGNLWMVTDSGTGQDSIYDFLGNNSMFFFPTEGPNAGTAYRFCTGPNEAELTGPVWSPDGRTLFVAVQHPGEDSESLDKLTSNFAAAPGTKVPRPTLVAISGFPGWR
jgi:secreted PhoX family phosphatase